MTSSSFTKVGLAVASLVASFIVTCPVTSVAQDASPPPAAGPAMPSVPTTKILAIGHLTGKWTPATRKAVMPDEVRATVQLYLGGKIDQWYVKQDQTGVVFVLNVTDVKEAHELLEKLPLGVAGLMEFELIPLGPLNPLRLLITPPPK